MLRNKLTIILLFASIAAAAQTVSVKDTVMRTYNYSDPDPVARTDRVYPYTRFNHFDFNAVAPFRHLYGLHVFLFMPFHACVCTAMGRGSTAATHVVSVPPPELPSAP